MTTSELQALATEAGKLARRWEHGLVELPGGGLGEDDAARKVVANDWRRIEQAAKGLLVAQRMRPSIEPRRP